jgi:hypothetical protein
MLEPERECMIGRERLGEMSILDVDRELNQRATTLNSMGESLLPQILAEEMSELRLRRTELEDQMVAIAVRRTGADPSECRKRLIRNNWDLTEVER